MPSSTSSFEPRTQVAGHKRLAALVACVLGIIALWLAAWIAMPLSPVSSQRYLAAVEDKVAMLAETKGEEDRIVLIAGSGAAFSISARQIGETLDRPVYNGGLQAGVGLRNLVDLYAPHLDPDKDLVVLLPEPEMLASDALYSQTWCDVLFLTKDVGGLARRLRCVPNVLWRTWQEGQHHINGTNTVDPVYRRSGFNARGDLTSHLGMERPVPDLSDYHHPDIPGEMLRTITSHVRQTLNARGIETLYVPAAMPLAGCEKSPEQVATMARELATLTARGAQRDAVGPDLAPFCLPPEMFFDGAGHLNGRGRVVQTANVARAISRHLERTQE